MVDQPERSDEGAVESENDEPGRLKRLAGSALAAGKQAAGASAAGMRKAREAVTDRPISDRAKSAASTGAAAAQTIASGTAKASAAGGRAAAKGARWAFDTTSAATAHVFSSAQALIASDLSSTVNEIVAGAVKGAPTIYDKAMDAVYIETHIGGGAHRLFDGGHTISGAFKAASEASADDTLIQETLGAIQGLLRDVSTPQGLPLATWDKPTYDAVAESLKSSFGIPKSWLNELVTYDAADLLGGSVGIVSVIYGWNRADTEKFAQMASSMALSAALSTNPVLMPIAVVALGRAFHKSRVAGDYGDLADGAFKGALVSGTSLGAIALVGVAGGPAGVGMLAGISAGVLAQKAAKNVELNDVCEFVKGGAQSLVGQIAAQGASLSVDSAEFAAKAGVAIAQGAATAGRQAVHAGAAVAGQAASAGIATGKSAAAAGRRMKQGLGPSNDRSGTADSSLSQEGPDNPRG
ncbi:hypothetical protein [Candidatus Poriferisodalis sp.]|uniref:hypothetical protein n=1 Tax=Candidatus Poriferisodalis sp. TaxID=3101277 RepID=UPI003B029419